MPDDDRQKVDDDDAKRLLEDEPDDAPDDDEPDDDNDKGSGGRGRDDADKDDRGDPAKLGDAGKKALDSMKRERNAARKELNEIRAKLKEVEDKDKSEAQRLQEAQEEAKGRAAKAEARSKALSIAMDRAPEHATLTHIRAVAKRVRGDDDDELESDADELFELLAPAPKDDDKSKRRVPDKPRQRLRGGSDPEDEPEENNPRKLAKLIRGD